MSTQAHILEVQPLKTFNGVNNILELFPDRLIIRRTDTLATYLPGMFSDTRTIDLDDIQAIFLHESKYVYSPWLMFVVQLTNHKHVTVLYDRKHYRQAEELKNAIDDFVSKREPLPPIHV